MPSPTDQPLVIAGAPWSVRMADSMLRRYPVSRMRWRYEDGFLVKAIEQVGLKTGELRYWQAVEDFSGKRPLIAKILGDGRG